MNVMSSPSRQKSWQSGRERVSVLAALAIQKENVSRKLTELRAQHELSQERAAARVGVTMRQWQRWESGASLPYTRNLDAIAEVFKVPVTDFFDEPDQAAAIARGPSDSASRLDHLETTLDEIDRKLDAVLAVLTALARATPGAGGPVLKPNELVDLLPEALKPDDEDQQQAG